MKKLISTGFIVGSLLAMADLTSISSEPIYEELIFLFLSFHWFWIQKQNTKIPKYILLSYIFLALTSMWGFTELFLTPVLPILKLLTILIFLFTLILFIKDFSKGKNEKNPSSK